MVRRQWRWRRLAVIVALAAGSATVGSLAQSSADIWWTGYGNGPDNSRYFAARQIDRSNVTELQVAWTYPFGDSGSSPIVVRGVVYGRGRNGSLVAVDARSGKELWVRENMNGMTSRGFNYWETAEGRDQRIIFALNSLLQEVDAKTGKSIMSFGVNGVVDLRDGIDGRDPDSIGNIQSNTPGEIFENLLILGSATGEGYMSPPGDIRAYDVLTGKLAWTFHTVPRPGEFGYDTWPKDAWKYVGGNNAWGEMTLDVARGIAFIPLGSPTYDFYGADRIGANLFGTSIVALDARTGKRLWHFQLVHHDLWDMDPSAAPQLTTIRQNGRTRDVVVVTAKTGWLYVFDRVTGEPIWPIEEKPVPQTDVPGEVTSPTQPIPTAPPPFARQSFTEKDINPYLTADEQAALRELLKNSRNEGVFTPPSMKGSIEMPGHNGGANWGSSAINPSKGTFYIASKELPTFLRIVSPGAPTGRGGRGGARGNAPAPGGPESGGARIVRNPGYAPLGPPPTPPPPPPAPALIPGAPAGFVAYNSPYDFMNNFANGMSAIGPPWSQLTAYDLNTGKILWRVPDGEMPGLPGGKTEQGSYAPRGGITATAGGLLFVGTSSDRKLRAYDQDTGKVLWSMDVPAAVEGVASVYEVGGREYVVFCVGGGAGLFAPRGVGITTPAGPAQYMALALPKR
jgi:quinoprotein glucose dehydrogenase